MKKYIKEIVIAIIQLFMFYIYPLFAGETDAMGMVFIIIIATLLLSFIIGGISGNWIKFLYPLATAIIFIPTVFIYYNESALVHSVWYFVISSLSLIAGAIIRKSKTTKKDKES